MTATPTAFTFPENPVANQEVTNTATGTRYIYLYPPGKWDVLLKDVSGDFVNTDGDTMTGPLELFMDDATSTGALQIKLTDDDSGNYFLKLRNDDNSIFGTINGQRQFTYNGKQIRLQPLGHDWYTLPTEGQSSSTSGLGFTLKGPAKNDATFSGTVLDCVFYGDVNKPTRVRYFGDSIGGNDLVNKEYVDNLVGTANAGQEALSYEGGTIQLGGDGGSQDGNLVVQQGVDENDNDIGGFLYVKNKEGTPSFVVGPSGRTETREDIFMVNEVDDEQRLYSFGTTNHKLTIAVGGLITAGGDTPVVMNKNLVLTYSGTALEGFGVTFNEDQQREQAVTFNPSKFHEDYYQPFTIQGVQTDDPQNRLLYATVVPALNFDISAARDEIYYFGSTSAGKTIQTRDSVQAMLNASAGNLDNYYTKTQTDQNFYKIQSVQVKGAFIDQGLKSLSVKATNLGHAFVVVDNIGQIVADMGGTTATGGYLRSYGTF